MGRSLSWDIQLSFVVMDSGPVLRAFRNDVGREFMQAKTPALLPGFCRL
jgi:hypothetical protein